MTVILSGLSLALIKVERRAHRSQGTSAGTGWSSWPDGTTAPSAPLEPSLGAWGGPRKAPA